MLQLPRRGQDEPPDRRRDVPRREDGQELRVQPAHQDGMSRAHRGSRVRGPSRTTDQPPAASRHTRGERGSPRLSRPHEHVRCLLGNGGTETERPGGGAGSPDGRRSSCTPSGPSAIRSERIAGLAAHDQPDPVWPVGEVDQIGDLGRCALSPQHRRAGRQTVGVGGVDAASRSLAAPVSMCAARVRGPMFFNLTARRRRHRGVSGTSCTRSTTRTRAAPSTGLRGRDACCGRR